MQKYHQLLDKVRDFRYLKVRERQISKFNSLLQKVGNISWSSIPPNANSHQPRSSTGPGSTNSLLQPGMSAGNADIHSQATSTNPPSAGKRCRQGRLSFPGRHELSVPVKAPPVLQQGKLLLPQTI